MDLINNKDVIPLPGSTIRGNKELISITKSRIVKSRRPLIIVNTFFALLLNLYLSSTYAVPSRGLDSAIGKLSCFDVMESVDRNGDGSLNRGEFVEAVNEISGGSFQDLFSFSFELLPRALQNTFDVLSCSCLRLKSALVSCCRGESAEIIFRGTNITSQKPLDEKCNIIETSLSLSKKQEQLMPLELDHSLVELCLSNVARLDGEHENTQHIEDEYIKLIKVLSGNDFSEILYQQLPLILRYNYENFHFSGSFSIFGTIYDDQISFTKNQLFTTFCEITIEALETTLVDEMKMVLSPRSTALTNSSVTTTISQSLINFLDCLRTMYVADTNRDDFMSSVEYVNFLDGIQSDESSKFNLRITGKIDETFNKLPDILRDNYFNSITVGSTTINISGNKPEDVFVSGVKQIQFLQEFCNSTEEALSIATKLHNSPEFPSSVSSSTTKNPLFPSQEIAISTPFKIFNSVGITADDIRANIRGEWAKLIYVYSDIVRISTERIYKQVSNEDKNPQLRAQRMKMPIEYIFNSAQANDFIEIPCPAPTIEKTICHLVSASFRVRLGTSENIDEIKWALSEIVLAEIKDGKFEAMLTEYGSHLRLFREKINNITQNSDSPIQPPATPLTNTPTVSQEDDPATNFVIFLVIMVSIVICIASSSYILLFRKHSTKELPGQSVIDSTNFYMIDCRTLEKLVQKRDSIIIEDYRYERVNFNPISLGGFAHSQISQQQFHAFSHQSALSFGAASEKHHNIASLTNATIHKIMSQKKSNLISSERQRIKNVRKKINGSNAAFPGRSVLKCNTPHFQETRKEPLNQHKSRVREKDTNNSDTEVHLRDEVCKVVNGGVCSFSDNYLGTSEGESSSENEIFFERGINSEISAKKRKSRTKEIPSQESSGLYLSLRRSNQNLDSGSNSSRDLAMNASLGVGRARELAKTTNKHVSRGDQGTDSYSKSNLDSDANESTSQQSCSNTRIISALGMKENFDAFIEDSIDPKIALTSYRKQNYSKVNYFEPKILNVEISDATNENKSETNLRKSESKNLRPRFINEACAQENGPKLFIGTNSQAVDKMNSSNVQTAIDSLRNNCEREGCHVASAQVIRGELNLKLESDSKKVKEPTNPSKISLTQQDTSNLLKASLDDFAIRKEPVGLEKRTDNFEWYPTRQHDSECKTKTSDTLRQEGFNKDNENFSSEGKYSQKTVDIFEKGLICQSIVTNEDSLVEIVANKAIEIRDKPLVSSFSQQKSLGVSGDSVIEAKALTSAPQQPPVGRKNITEKEETLLRSALDDAEGSSEDTEYTDSDDNTYDEGTYVHSLGTFEDTMADMKTEDAIAYALAAAKRAEDQAEVDANTFTSELDTNDFDKQIADFQDRQNTGVDMHHLRQELVDEFSGTSDESTSSDSSEESEESESIIESEIDDSSSEDATVDHSLVQESSTVDLQIYYTDGTVGKDLINDSTEFQRHIQIRRDVEKLVRELVPDEVDNLDALFLQFAGREEELLNTLHTMRERRSKARARAAVHRSAASPPRRICHDSRNFRVEKHDEVYISVRSDS